MRHNFRVGDEIRHVVTGERAVVSYVNPACGNVYIRGEEMFEIAPAGWNRDPQKVEVTAKSKKSKPSPQSVPVNGNGNGNGHIEFRSNAELRDALLAAQRMIEERERELV
jgi:hypothetical protein